MAVLGLESGESVLAIAPHADNEPLGADGAIHRLTSGAATG
jgi:LmbE family N-acetylglucosaminyl deacetylase